MALRDKAHRPDVGAVVAMADELVATSHELMARSRDAVEHCRHVRAQVQARRQGCDDELTSPCEDNTSNELMSDDRGRLE
jgi:hypothetical protein